MSADTEVIYAPSLADIRLELSQIGHDLTLHLANQWQHAPACIENKLEPTQGLDREKSQYLIALYQTLSTSLKDERLREKYAACKQSDRGVSRILSGVDFTEGDKQPNLTDVQFKVIKQVLQLEDALAMDLLARRCALVEQVGQIKQRESMQLRNREREQILLDEAITLAAQHRLPTHVIVTIYHSILFPLAFEIEESLLESPIQTR